jgi:hypothetical protein
LHIDLGSGLIAAIVDATIGAVILLVVPAAGVGMGTWMAAGAVLSRVEDELNF